MIFTAHGRLTMKNMVHCLFMSGNLALANGNSQASNGFYINESQSIINILTIISSLLSIGLVIYGVTSLGRFKEKKDSASFTYWTQFRIHVVMMKEYLEKYPQICDNIWNTESRRCAAREGAIVKGVLKEFQDECTNFLDFVKGASDQIPAYRGWTKDYSEVITCTTDMIVYDVTDSTHKFKHRFSSEGIEINVELAEMEDYYRSFLNYLQRMDKGILDCQINIEKKICV